MVILPIILGSLEILNVGVYDWCFSIDADGNFFYLTSF
jgi:hypothetical protein